MVSLCGILLLKGVDLMSIDNNKLGDRLKKIRKGLNLTQAQLAEKAGISLMSIRRYESGERTPNFKQLEKLAVAMGIHFYEFGDDPNADSAFIELDDDFLFVFSDDTVNKDRLLSAFDRMNSTGKKVAADRVEELAQIPAYQKDDD